MIDAVFFDLYGTLARFHPPTEVLQATACREFGMEVTPEGIIRGYAAADDFMARENARVPIFQREEPERKTFFAEYQRLILRGAGVSASTELARRVWERVSQIPKDLALFDDVLPALEELKRRRLVLGLISNINRNMEELTRRLDIGRYLDFWVTSQEVGANKPDPRIFEVALRKAHTWPSRALHVGDQYNSDVVGAYDVGIRPLLLDREGILPEPGICPKIRGLGEVLQYV
ncbi:MAG: HAD-IA family hydrolase [Chloroflexi bacterium]|nr:HAD-IA family hydrolase [Chloroflexota bacterium]